jgi:protein-S-isoprenylcysteine O-methyltransferase Ste14
VTALGVGLALGSWQATILTLIVSGAAVLCRIHVEEELLVSELGEEYVR